MKLEKKIKSLFALLLLIAITTSSFAQLTQTASVEGITEYQLDNGLKVLLFPDNSSQTITVNITYLVGSRHEGYGEKGMAHLLEHLVFKGTPNHPDIPKELTSHGARPNGTTWYDRTNYFETFNATDENLDWALDLESDRMVNSYIAKKDLESEFSVVRNEFESGENSPTSVLMKNVISASFTWHNYGQSTIGNRSDIERVPIENLKAFYKKYYRPDNAVLMVTGKFELEKTKALIIKKFGQLKNPSVALNDVPTIEPPQDGERRVQLERVGDLQVLAALYHTPAGSHIDYSAMALIENVLTDQPSGRLYKALIDSKKASAVWSFSPFTKEPSFMYINVDVPSTNSLPEAEKILLNTFDGLKDNPITAEELKRAKANMLKQMDQVFRNSSYLGTYMSEFIGAGDWRLAFIHRDRVENMTLADVNEVLGRYFIPTNRTVGSFKPTKNPVRVGIPHTEGLDALVSAYKGKEVMAAGEAFDVSYDNIQNRLENGTITGTGIKYGFIKKANRGETVYVNVGLRNGSIDQLMNKGMTPSMVAQMLNKGSISKSRQDIEDKLSQLKSSVFFSGRAGRVFAYVNSTQENLMPTLELMAEIIKNPKFDATELDKLKTQQLANIEANLSEPTFQASRRLGQINQQHPKGHPNYSMTVEEQIAAIKAVTIEDMKAYHKEFYGTSEMSTVTAIGNIEEAQLKSFFEKEFANFKAKHAFEQFPSPFAKANPANEQLKTPDKKNAFTTGVFNFEANQSDDDYAALQVASAVFGGGFLNSRIADRLRQKDGVSYGAGGGISVDDDTTNRNSSMYIYAIYAPDNAAKVQLGFKEEIARFIEGGITQEELDNAVKGWVQAQAVSRAKDNELASVINNNMYYSRDMSTQKELEEKVKVLTVEDVNRAIKKHFKPLDQWTVVNAGDFNNMIDMKDEKVKN